MERSRGHDMNHHHDYLLDTGVISKNEKKTCFVVMFTGAMMVIEIIAGTLTSSMALLADGWHMASHAGALGISLVVYRLAKSQRMSQHFSFGTGKLLPLGGYTSAIALAFIAILMIVESIQRIMSPPVIHFDEAIVVAIVGLVVNVVCVRALWDPHHQHNDNDPNCCDHVHDPNLRSAYFHVLADALTSILAIVALVAGKIFHIMWLDPVIGILASVVILRWATNLTKDTGWELLDGHARGINIEELKATVEKSGANIEDIHVWKVAPGTPACEIAVSTNDLKGPQFYRDVIQTKFGCKHIIVEERVL